MSARNARSVTVRVLGRLGSGSFAGFTVSDIGGFDELDVLFEAAHSINAKRREVTQSIGIYLIW
jgi:hypothetical protein